MSAIVTIENTALVNVDEEHYLNDLGLIQEYLSQTDTGKNPAFSDRTLENYKRDLHRLMIFLSGRQRHLDTATKADVIAFSNWLDEPPENLIGEHRYPVSDPRWRPFYRSGLSESSHRQQFASVKAFYRWLHHEGHIKKNVFATIRQSKAKKIKTKRHLHIDDVLFISEFVRKKLPGDTKQARKMVRYRWLWFAYVLSGLRISELIKLTTDDLVSDRIKGETVWYLKVLGKGRDEREDLAVSTMFVDELHIYRNSLGLESTPLVAEPLVLSLTGRSGLTDRSSAHREFKDLITMVANHKLAELKSISDSVSESEYIRAKRKIDALREASVHWLRHSFVTTMLDSSEDLPMVSSLARHKDIKTTMVYDHSELAAQSKVMNDYARQFVNSDDPRVVQEEHVYFEPD